jgi:ABC-type sugar transport system permease subunit
VNKTLNKTLTTTANSTDQEVLTMYDSRFFQSKLGQAAIASVAAMAAFVALSSQIQASPALAATIHCETVELA